MGQALPGGPIIEDLQSRSFAQKQVPKLELGNQLKPTQVDAHMEDGRTPRSGPAFYFKNSGMVSPQVSWR